MEHDMLPPMFAAFDQGAPIPTVTANDIKQYWKAVRRLHADRPPRPGVAIGLGVWQAYDVDAAKSVETFLPVDWRHGLLTALVERGLLREYRSGNELDDRLYQAAATMPCNKEDLAEALVLLRLSLAPEEIAAKAREELRAHGYEPDKPAIDAKFQSWLTEHT